MELLLTVGAATGLPASRSLEGSKTVVIGRLPGSDGWFRTQTLRHERDLQWNTSFGICVWNLADSIELHVVNESSTIKERRSFGKVLIPLLDVQAAPNKTLRKSCAFVEGGSGSLEVFLQLSGTLPPARIAVIGAGVTGAAAARFLADRFQELGSKATVTVFEQEPHIGGRVASVTVAGETVELGGGLVLNTGKGYFFEFAKRFGLELQQAAELNVDWGIWDGERIVFEKARDTSQYLMSLLDRFGPTAMTALHEAQTNVFSKYNELFECVARFNSYHTLPDLLTDGRLLQLTQLSLAEYLRNRGVSVQAIEALCSPLSRRAFGLPPGGLNAFAGISGVLLDQSPLYSIRGGNVQLIHALLKGSGATVRTGTRVASIARNLNAGTYVITAKQGKDKKATTKTEFDAVIVAVPAHALKKIKLDFELPSSLAQLRPYVEVYEAYVAGELNEKYFHAKEGSLHVQSILTTNNKEIPFTSIQKVRSLAEGRAIYRVVSSQSISDSLLKTIFHKISDKQFHHWQAAYPLPVLTSETVLPPFCVAQRFYFANPMEHCFPSIEGALLGARNVTGLLLKSLVRPVPPIRVLKGGHPMGGQLTAAFDPAAHVADVVIVGSGLSGLTTALRVLQGAPPGQRPFKIVVVESSSTLGGRTRSLELPESPYREHVSYGGTWVAFDDEQTLSLARELKFMPFAPKGDQGTSFIISNLVLHPFFLLRLWLLGEDIRKDPKEHVELDALPLSEWLSNQSGVLDKKSAINAVRDYFTAIEDFPHDLSKVSTYFAARQLNIRLTNITRTGFIIPRIFRWEGGTGAFVRKLVSAVLDLGGEVRTQSRVREIRQELPAGPATVTLDDGSFYSAKQVVIAAAPPVAASLRYDPPLPAEMMKISTLLKGWDDPAVQIILSWPTRWWKLRGTVLVAALEDEATGVYGPIMDLSDHDPRTHHKSPTGIIRILVKLSRVIDSKGRIWEKDRLKADTARFLSHHLHATPERVLSDLQDFVVFNWEEERDIGHIAWYYPPTKDSIYAKLLPWLRRPHGLVRFAGSERSERGAHWMEGAIRRGNEVAGEVLNALAPSKFNLKIYWQRFKHFASEALHDLHRREVLLLGRNIVDLFSHLFHPLLTITKATRDLFAFMQRSHTRLITGPQATPLLTGPVAPFRGEILTDGEQQLYDSLHKKFNEPRWKASRIAFSKRDHVVDTSVIALPWSKDQQQQQVPAVPSSGSASASSPVSSPPQSRESTPQRPGRPIPVPTAAARSSGAGSSPARGPPAHALAIRGSPPVPSGMAPRAAAVVGSPPVSSSPPVERPELENRMSMIGEQLQLLHEIVAKSEHLEKDATATKLVTEARETRTSMSKWIRSHQDNSLLPRVLETLRRLEHELRAYDEKVSWQQGGGKANNAALLSAGNPNAEVEQVMRAFAAHNQQLGFFTFPSQEALRIFLEAHSSFLNWSGTSFRLMINCSDGNILRAAEIIRWLRAPSSPFPRAAIMLIHPLRAPFKDIPADKRLTQTDDLKAAQKFAIE